MNDTRARPIVLVAACALLNEEGKVLIAKRPPGRPLAGLWEFPGGKVDLGEDPETALIRELLEELGIEIARADLLPLTFASHAYPEFHLLMPLYLCKRWQGSIAAQEDRNFCG
jgi:8-oxo-dGTP diphosphatase